MPYLDTRNELENEFYRLTNTDSADDFLIEHDSTSKENVVQLLQQGLDDAQLFLLDCGAEWFWVQDSATLTFTGSWPDRYATVSATGLRLYGDERKSPLYRANGNRWGKLVPWEYGRLKSGDYFYVRQPSGVDELRVYFSKNASPPSDLKAEFVRRATVMDDGTDVPDFPKLDRALIVAYAAVHGMAQAWLPGGPEMEGKLVRNLEFRKQQAYRRARHSRDTKRIKVQETLGDHWF